MSFDAGLFWSTLVSPAFLWAALTTLSLTVLAHAGAILLSLPLALALDSKRAVLRALAKAYVAFFRALPALLLLLFVWNGLPQVSPVFREAWFSPFVAALLALSFNEAAYQVEINRAALSAVDKGQFTAGAALGFHRMQVFRLIVVPQALRIALPPTVNEFITLLKTTSLASVISLTELMAVTQAGGGVDLPLRRVLRRRGALLPRHGAGPDGRSGPRRAPLRLGERAAPPAGSAGLTRRLSPRGSSAGSRVAAHRRRGAILDAAVEPRHDRERQWHGVLGR